MAECRVLVVDDELDFLETIVKLLNKRNLEVMGAESGEKALELLENEPFDVVVLDIRMPGMDGIETLREIKKRKPSTEVIMLTGHGSIESGLQGLQLGAYDYVMKPAELEDLVERIRKAFERRLIHLERKRLD
jgi:two-component system OmpR family response regulator